MTKATIIFDNGGGVILKLYMVAGIWAHHYGDPTQAASDLIDAIDCSEISYEGHEQELVEFWPSDEEINNGGYRLIRLDSTAEAVEWARDLEQDCGWSNMRIFAWEIMQKTERNSMASTRASNKQLVDSAKQSARARIEAVLRMAVPALQRIGPDNSENRALVAQLCGLPEPDQYIVDQDRLVGIDAAGGTLPMTKLVQPAEFDKAVGAARLLVATINDAIECYMAGDDARTAVEVKQYEASAR